MKNIIQIIIILSLIFPLSGYGQSNDLTQLKNKKKQLQNQIKSLQYELNDVNKKIKALESQSASSDAGVVTTINSYGGIMRDKPSALGKELALIKEGEKVTVLNEHVGLYLKVSYMGKTGYLNYSCMNANPEIDKILTNKTVDNSTSNTVVRTVNTDDPNFKRLESLYGKEKAMKITNHELWKGMSHGMVIESIGKPTTKKSVNTLDGLQETWSYPNKEIIFLNGDLNSWTDK